MDVLNRSTCMVEILSLQETKLDDSFTGAQFSVPGYRLHIKDYKSNSGGLMMWIRDDLPQQRRKDLDTIEYKVVGLNCY